MLSKYRIFKNIQDISLSEQDIFNYDSKIFENLLIDYTMTLKKRSENNDLTAIVNIFFATKNYENSVLDSDGNVITNGYNYDDEIKIDNIVNKPHRIIIPRLLKPKQTQKKRTKDNAEVFTPSWICNAQNNLIDEAWFGCKDVFNQEITNSDNTEHTWQPSIGKIDFPIKDSEKTWQNYIENNCLEICCGEAPYLVSRYDTTTGKFIPINNRVGLLDRKMRIVTEHSETEDEWYSLAEKAFKHTYGYEFQGDNLLIARENLFFTYIEYFIDKFNNKDENGRYIPDSNGEFHVPAYSKLYQISEIISWNLWQMDGLRNVVPNSCSKVFETNVNGKQYQVVCPACQKNPKKDSKHIGTYCLIKDWQFDKIIQFRSLIN